MLLLLFISAAKKKTTPGIVGRLVRARFPSAILMISDDAGFSVLLLFRSLPISSTSVCLFGSRVIRASSRWCHVRSGRAEGGEREEENATGRQIAPGPPYLYLYALPGPSALLLVVCIEGSLPAAAAVSLCSAASGSSSPCQVLPHRGCK